MNVGTVVKKVWKEIIPELKVNRDAKQVYLKENLFFSYITETYYTLKGYSVERVSHIPQYSSEH